MAFCALLVGTPAFAQTAPTFVAAASATPSGTGSSNSLRKLTFTVPGTVQAGDLMLVQIAVKNGSKITVAPPTGWVTALRTDYGSKLMQVVYYKVATASQSAEVFTYDKPGDGSAKEGAGVFVAYRGVDTAAPIIKAAKGSVTSDTTSLVTPIVTVSQTNTRVMHFVSVQAGSGAAFTAPAQSTERIQKASGDEDDGVTIQVSDFSQASAGSIAARKVVCQDDEDMVAQTIVIAPYVAPAVVTATSFNAFDTTTSSTAVTGNIRTKVVGSGFGLTLVALNSQGARQNNFSGSVRVNLLDSSTSSGTAPSGSNCLPSWTVVTTLLDSIDPNAKFSGGKLDLTGVVVNRAYRNVRIQVVYTTGTGGQATTTSGCSTDAFAIRPSSFDSPVASDTDWKTFGTVRTLSNSSETGGNVHAAGQPFTVRATLVNGTGYDGSPNLVLASCVRPTTCASGVTEDLSGTLSVVNSANGLWGTDSAVFTDVGVITATIEDRIFTSVDIADGTPDAQRLITSAAFTIGRFVPDSYSIDLSNDVLLPPVLAAGCAPADNLGSFTWIGQPFTWAVLPAFTVVAQNAGGGVLMQYQGTLRKLTLSHVSFSWASTTAPASVLPLVVTGQTASLSVGSPDVAGVASLTLGSNSLISFTRPLAPVAFFNAIITLTVNIADTSETGVTGNGTIPADAALVVGGDPLGGVNAPGITFQGGSGANLQLYGRLQLAGANGDSRRPLSLVYETQAWSGAAWYRNQRDSCFTPAATIVALSSWTGSTTTCDASVTAVTRATRGQGLVKLSAPLGQRSVGVTATLRLNAASGTTCIANASASTTGAAQSWLQGPWTSATGLYNTDPAARVTWGRARNDILMRREQ